MDISTLMNGAPLTTRDFKQPPREFGIFPFWFVNGEMTYEEMEWQLKEFKAKGMPGIFFHARFGIKDYMPYLGDDWFDRVKFTVEKAQEIGLQVWIYDEYNWPSGTADQQIQKDRPELTSTYLEAVVSDIPGQFFTFMEGTDSRYNDLEQSEPVYACAILQSDFDKGNDVFINLMPSLSFDKVITWEAPAGPWKLMYFIERQASWYTDVLNEETTKEFLDRCHERYLESMGGSFSGNLKGFYTDEPAMFYFESGRDNHIIPWSNKVFRVFREHNGYELRANLPKLFYDIGSDYEQVRYDYYNALSRQYEKAYYKQIADWCEEKDVVFTGHLLYEESLRRHTRTGGNLFHHLQHLDMTGVDHLYPRIGTRDMPDEHVALKLASSAAHQFGSARLLCESMGGSYWDATMRRMKWIADWEYLLGVNLLNPHGFHYSIEGERKRDWPPSQFYHHTWWEQYKLFNTYMTRLGYSLSGGRHVCPIAMIYPMSSIWANFVPQQASRISSTIENDFNFMTDRLLRLHVDYDYLDEDVLAERCEVSDGVISILDEKYECVILPPMTHIKASTLKALEDFVAGGGRLIGGTLLPTAIVEGEAPDLKKRIDSLFGLDSGAVRKAFANQETGRYNIRENNYGKGKTLFIEGPGLAAGREEEILRRVVLKSIKPAIEIDDKEIFSLHRYKDEQDLFFLINPTSELRTAEVKINRRCRPLSYDLETGDISPLAVYTVDDDSVRFTMEMHPCGSALISTDHEADAVHVEKADFTVTGISEKRLTGYGNSSKYQTVVSQSGKKSNYMALGGKTAPALEPKGPWQFKCTGPNALLLGKYKFNQLGRPGSYSQETLKGMVQPGYIDKEWLDFAIGAWEMQLPQERDDSEYPVDLIYRAGFSAEYIPEDLEIMIDGFKGTAYQLYINGQLYTGDLKRSYLDAEIKSGSITGYVKPGYNVLAVVITAAKRTHGLLDLIKITGTFSLSGQAADEKEALAPNITSEYKIVSPKKNMTNGWWTENGYPYYSGTGIFQSEFNLDEEYADKILRLQLECGEDVLEVKVNGQDAGFRLWNPYEIDITPYAQTGKNTLEIRVTNTMINILEAVEQRSGFANARIEALNRIEVILQE